MKNDRSPRVENGGADMPWKGLSPKQDTASTGGCHPPEAINIFSSIYKHQIKEV
jgi:hypothetical protein